MVETAVTRGDLLHLSDLVLMQQARLHDLSTKAGRSRSAAALQGLFRSLQEVLKPEFTVEIGAHSAQFSQDMSRLGIEAHAFEANPYNHAAFAGQIAKFAPDVRYHHMAVSDADGQATFQIRLDDSGQAMRRTGSNSLLPREDNTTAYEMVTVPACRLDTFLNQTALKGREFSAWIDVEGALGKVTAGFGPALQSCLSLIVEVEEKRYWQDQMLVQDVMAYLDGQGMVPVARDFEYVYQYNMVYVRRDVMARRAVRLALTTYLATSHSAAPEPDTKD